MADCCCSFFKRRNAKLLLRVVGALVDIIFVAQAIFIFATPVVTDFFNGCHWLGQGLLCAGVGCAGLYMEVKGSLSSVRTDCSRFLFNRIGVSIFYFWLGLYVMGGDGLASSSPGWQIVAHITGFVAWAVAAGDLCVSCLFEEDAEQGGLVADPPRPEAPPDTSQYGRSAASVEPRPQTFDSGARPNPFDAGAGKGSGKNDLDDINLTEDPEASASDFQWNSTARKPFGL